MTWDDWSRSSLDLASSAASFGFTAVKATTRFGFRVTRGVAGTAVGITTTIVDHTLFGGSIVTRPLSTAVASALGLAEQVAMAPIYISEYITSSSLLAAHSSINLLSVIFPGSSEASFSLASFITLVKREISEPEDGSVLPEQGRYGITQIARAIVAWVALQGVTQEWQERHWFKYLKEIHVRDPPKNFDSMRARRGSRIRVTSDIIFPDNSGQILSADIGEAPVRAQSIFLSPHSTPGKAAKRSIPKPHSPISPRISNAELKSTLRRLSKMVLAGYGGASLLFFGVPLPTNPNPSDSASSPAGTSSTSSSATSPLSNSPRTRGISTVPPTMPSAPQARSEEAQLAAAIVASEAEALGEGASDILPPPPTPASGYSWWDVLLGKHDHEIFANSAASYQTVGRSRNYSRFSLTGRGPRPSTNPNIPARKMDVTIGMEHLMPRFWVLSDHGRRQIVLVLRGTMSLNEIAVDLTCEPETFLPAGPPEDEDDLPYHDDAPLPGRFVFPGQETPKPSGKEVVPIYHVHSGMLRMARAMGDTGRPVHAAVKEALFHNPDYDLVLCGHSLGAGVAALLGLLWADPHTCLTTRSSGLPVGRRTSVYCFAPPSLMTAELSRLSGDEGLVTSFVYSHDVVSRLSLGSVRDLKSAAMWLCEEERRASLDTKQSGSEGGDIAGYSNVTARARRWKNGEVQDGDEDWFIAVRKTLEASMQSSHMYPPGRVLWAMRDSDLHAVHRSQPSSDTSGDDKLRLFEVLDVEQVFKQIVFARDMLSAHMPHKYDSTLHDLL